MAAFWSTRIDPFGVARGTMRISRDQGSDFDDATVAVSMLHRFQSGRLASAGTDPRTTWRDG